MRYQAGRRLLRHVLPRLLCQEFLPLLERQTAHLVQLQVRDRLQPPLQTTEDPTPSTSSEIVTKTMDKKNTHRIWGVDPGARYKHPPPLNPLSSSTAFWWVRRPLVCGTIHSFKRKSKNDSRLLVSLGPWVHLGHPLG